MMRLSKIKQKKLMKYLSWLLLLAMMVQLEHFLRFGIINVRFCFLICLMIECVHSFYQ